MSIIGNAIMVGGGGGSEYIEGLISLDSSFFYENAEITSLPARCFTNRFGSVEYETAASAAYSSFVLSFPNVKSIETNCFHMNFSITEIKLPNLETCGSGYNIFRDCPRITKLRLPKLISMAGTTAATYFTCRCTSLALVDLGPVERIQWYSFYNDSALTALILRGTSVIPLQNTNAFTGTPIASGTGKIYVFPDLISSYQSATNWLNYQSQFKPLYIAATTAQKASYLADSTVPAEAMIVCDEDETYTIKE